MNTFKKLTVKAVGVLIVVGFIFSSIPSAKAELSTIPAIPVTNCSKITYSLAAGSKDVSSGYQVSVLQNYLKANGYFYGSVNGVYGADTTAAVKLFQKNNGLEQVGNVGPKTKDKINQYMCGSSTQFSTGNSNSSYSSSYGYSNAYGTVTTPKKLPEYVPSKKTKKFTNGSGSIALTHPSNWAATNIFFNPLVIITFDGVLSEKTPEFGAGILTFAATDDIKNIDEALKKEKKPFTKEQKKVGSVTYTVIAGEELDPKTGLMVTAKLYISKNPVAGKYHSIIVMAVPTELVSKITPEFEKMIKSARFSEEIADEMDELSGAFGSGSMSSGSDMFGSSFLSL